MIPHFHSMSRGLFRSSKHRDLFLRRIELHADLLASVESDRAERQRDSLSKRKRKAMDSREFRAGQR